MGIREDTLDETIAAVESLAEACADEMTPETEMMHKFHRQSYLQTLATLETLRSGPRNFPGVPPERHQLFLLDSAIAFLGANDCPIEARELEPTHVFATRFCEWLKEQVIANAQARGSILSP